MNNWVKIWKFVRNIRIRNWKVVLLCILAATIFKLFNSLNKDYTTSVYYPIHFEFDQQHLVVMEELPENIHLNVSGDGWTLFRKTFGVNVNPLSIPLERPIETKKLLASSLMPLVTEQVKDLKLNFIVTDTLYFNIEPELEKKFIVLADSLSIHLEENYRIVGNVLVSSDSVLLKGPKPMIESLPDTLWLDIPVKGIDEDYDRRMSLEVPGDVKGLVHKFPSTFEVSFSVREFVDNALSLRLKPLHFPDDSSVLLKDSMVQLSFKSPKENEKLKEEDFEVLVDYKERNQADSTVGVKIEKLPPNVFNPHIDSSQQRIRLYYRKK